MDAMHKITIEKAELGSVMSTLAQAEEALLFGGPLTDDELHWKWHDEAVKAVQLAITNLRQFLILAVVLLISFSSTGAIAAYQFPPGYVPPAGYEKELTDPVVPRQMDHSSQMQPRFIPPGTNVGGNQNPPSLWLIPELVLVWVGAGILSYGILFGIPLWILYRLVVRPMFRSLVRSTSREWKEGKN